MSVRTLHYYDEINLLKPAEIDENNGYRFYDRTALERMQEILFYRELGFPLKSICEILSSPDYDKQKALSEQKKLLILKKERLERIISAIDNAEESEVVMKALNNNDYEVARKQYEAEAKERWGKTEKYREHTEKTKDYSKSLMTCFFFRKLASVMPPPLSKDIVEQGVVLLARCTERRARVVTEGSRSVCLVVAQYLGV